MINVMYIVNYYSYIENKKPLGIDLLQAMFEHGEGLLLSLAPYLHQLLVMPKHQVHHRVSGLALNVHYMMILN